MQQKQNVWAPVAASLGIGAAAYYSMTKGGQGVKNTLQQAATPFLSGMGMTGSGQSQMGSGQSQMSGGASQMNSGSQMSGATSQMKNGSQMNSGSSQMGSQMKSSQQNQSTANQYQ